MTATAATAGWLVRAADEYGVAETVSGLHMAVEAVTRAPRQPHASGYAPALARQLLAESAAGDRTWTQHDRLVRALAWGVDAAAVGRPEARRRVLRRWSAVRAAASRPGVTGSPYNEEPETVCALADAGVAVEGWCPRPRDEFGEDPAGWGVAALGPDGGGGSTSGRRRRCAALAELRRKLRGQLTHRWRGQQAASPGWLGRLPTADVCRLSRLSGAALRALSAAGILAGRPEWAPAPLAVVEVGGGRLRVQWAALAVHLDDLALLRQAAQSLRVAAEAWLTPDGWHERSGHVQTRTFARGAGAAVWASESEAHYAWEPGLWRASIARAAADQARAMADRDPGRWLARAHRAESVALDACADAAHARREATRRIKAKLDAELRLGRAWSQPAELDALAVYEPEAARAAAARRHAIHRACYWARWGVAGRLAAAVRRMDAARHTPPTSPPPPPSAVVVEVRRNDRRLKTVVEEAAIPPAAWVAGPWGTWV